MAGERIYPILPCADLDDALTFYRALGFAVTYEQRRPNPSAVVEREEIAIHLAAIEGFDPAGSYGSAIITVPDPEGMHAAFKEGLRQQFGKVPITGIPRLLPPRRKAGTATGFTVVDSGGNWLRFYRSGSTEDDPGDRRSGLGRAIDVAARQGDARGDERRAIAVLDAALLRHPDAPPVELFEALLYRGELKGRCGIDARGDLEAAEMLIECNDLGEAAVTALSALREALGP